MERKFGFGKHFYYSKRYLQDSYIQVFKIDETDKFLSSIIQCMSLFGSTVHKNIIKKPMIPKEEVSGQKF